MSVIYKNIELRQANTTSCEAVEKIMHNAEANMLYQAKLDYSVCSNDRM